MCIRDSFLHVPGCEDKVWSCISRLSAKEEALFRRSTWNDLKQGAGNGERAFIETALEICRNMKQSIYFKSLAPQSIDGTWNNLQSIIHDVVVAVIHDVVGWHSWPCCCDTARLCCVCFSFLHWLAFLGLREPCAKNWKTLSNNLGPISAPPAFLTTGWPCAFVYYWKPPLKRNQLTLIGKSLIRACM